MAHTLIINALIISEGASLDAFTGRVTAFNMLEEVAAAAFPAVLPKLFVLVLYEREGDAPSAPLREEVTLTNSSQERILASDSILDSSKRFHRSVHHLVGLPIPIDGDYRIGVQVFEGEQVIARHSRTMVVRRVPQQSEGQPTDETPAADEQ